MMRLALQPGLVLALVIAGAAVALRCAAAQGSLPPRPVDPANPAPPGGGAELEALQRRLPWDITRDEIAKLPWEGLHDDLDALLKVQARGREVAVVVFNEGFSQLALNCLVSLIKYGNSPNYIVTSVGAGSLAYCRSLRLPCYDGANLLTNVSVATGDGAVPVTNSSALSTDIDAQRYSADWFHLVWIKTLVAHAVNARGYDILFADADVVFLKDAWKAYRDLLARYNADGTFMYEQGLYTRPDNSTFLHKYLNSGNFLLRSNARTRNMMDMWRVGYEFQINVNGNQLWLNRLDKLAYKICHTPKACRNQREDRWAAIKPHPNQFAGRGAMCTPDKLEDGVCTDRRLYVHAVCKQGHREKAAAFKRLGFWFIDVDRDDHTKVTVSLPQDGSLPCGGTTWEDEYPFSS